MIYLIILITLLYFVYKYDICQNTGYRDSAFWGLCIVFIFLAGLRYRIGGDTLGYMSSWDFYPDFWNFNWFNDIEKCRISNPEMERYQTGWFLFVIFVTGVWKHQVIMQMAVAILLNYSIFRIIKKYSEFPFITLMVYCFNFKFFEFEFEIMRESVAVSIFLLISFDNYIKREWIKYYAGTIIAYFIHPSAIFMFVLPFFRNVNLSLIKNTLIFVVPPIVIGIAGRIILGNLLTAILNQDADSTAYVMNAVDKEYNSNYILMYLYQPLMLYLLVVTCYRKIKGSIYSPLIFFALFFLYFSVLYFTASRLANYIIIPVYIGITPIIYYWIKRFKTVLILPIILLIFNVPTIFEFQRSPEGRARYFPYQNVIFPDRSPIQKKIDKTFNLK